MVSRADGRLSLTKDEAAIVAAVRGAQHGYAEPGKRVETYTRSDRRTGAIEVVTVVGPERLVRGLVDAGVLRASLSGLVELGDLGE